MIHRTTESMDGSALLYFVEQDDEATDEDLLHHVPRTSTIAFVDYVATIYSPPLPISPSPLNLQFRDDAMKL
jgi:hypothetical protein